MKWRAGEGELLSTYSHVTLKWSDESCGRQDDNKGGKTIDQATISLTAETSLNIIIFMNILQNIPNLLFIYNYLIFNL